MGSSVKHTGEMLVAMSAISVVDGYSLTSMQKPAPSLPGHKLQQLLDLTMLSVRLRTTGSIVLERNQHGDR